ncbi:RHS repeat-associated core domain-containing protein [Streptomyces sp. NPDC057336]|uniref:RHS repeat-associated core domain-containing protein n=1 Tax=Streptomyces sp. NPDC057336 TaxID=3346102 RepID=UPI00362B0BFE
MTALCRCEAALRWLGGEGSLVAQEGPGLSGSLSAITAATDAVVLQLTNLHGDNSLVLPLNSSVAPTALSADEYGRQRTSGAVSGYGWLGGMQRSSRTPTGQLLMGVRLYNPATGRFLQVDPVVGGSRNAYEYAAGNPVSNYDLDGRRVYRYSQRTLYRFWGKVILKRWSNKSNMKRSYSTRWTFNRRWTNRIAYYGPYASGFLAIAAGAVAFIPAGQPTALILLALSAAALAIGMIAGQPSAPASASGSTVARRWSTERPSVTPTSTTSRGTPTPGRRDVEKQGSCHAGVRDSGGRDRSNGRGVRRLGSTGFRPVLRPCRSDRPLRRGNPLQHA